MSYTEKAAKYLCWFSYGTALFLFFKYGFPAVLPFAIAFVASTLAEKAAYKLSRKTGISKRVYCAVILVLCIATALTVLTAALGRLIYEAKEFAEEYLNDSSKMEKLLGGVNDLSSKLTEKLNLTETAKTRVKSTMDNAASHIADMLLNKIGAIIEKAASVILSGIPAWVLFLTVTVISTFYLGCGSHGNDPLMSLLTTEQKKTVVRIKSGIALTVAKYVKAYSTLLTITASVLFFGFSLVKVKYAFIVALLVAVLDLLPVIGIGTILIPWGIISIMNGNPGRGFGLFAVFAAAVVIREVAEAKVIGKCIGANPVITLFAMYTGIKLFGFGGLILMPMLASGIIAYYSEKNKTADIKKRSIGKRA